MPFIVSLAAYLSPTRWGGKRRETIIIGLRWRSANRQNSTGSFWEYAKTPTRPIKGREADRRECPLLAFATFQPPQQSIRVFDATGNSVDHRPLSRPPERPADTVTAHHPRHRLSDLPLQHWPPRHQREFTRLLDQRKPPADQVNPAPHDALNPRTRRGIGKR